MRTLSSTATREFFAQESGDAHVFLLTLTNADLPSPIRIANNWDQRLSEDAANITYGLVSRGNSFIYLPFDITPPADSADKVPQASITLFDALGELVPSLRTTDEEINVLVELVMKSTPDTVEASWPGLQLGAVEIESGTISGSLGLPDLESEPFPADGFTPAYFPGAF